MQCTQIWTPPWGSSYGGQGGLSFYVGAKGMQWSQISHRKLKISISHGVVILASEPDDMLTKVGLNTSVLQSAVFLATTFLLANYVCFLYCLAQFKSHCKVFSLTFHHSSQGIAKQWNCRLSTKTPDYQLGCGVLALCRQQAAGCP